MSTTVSTGITPEAFEAFLADRQEPAWLLEARRAAWQVFQDLPLPSRADEEWMRTDIRLFRLDKFNLPVATPTEGELPQHALMGGVHFAGVTAALDSRPVLTQFREPTLAKQGVLFGSLDELVREHGDLIRGHLFRAVNGRADKFAALHAACWSGGAILYVPKGISINEPFHMFSAISPGGVDFGHTLVILEDGASATLLSETAGGSDQQGLHCGAIELVVGPGAKLRYVNLQNWGTGVWHFAHQKALVEAGGQLQWTIGALGARLAKVNQHVALTGQDAYAQVNGVMFTEGKQHLSYHTLQHHQAPYCKSDLLYKGALQDQSRLVWRGMIKVDHGAQKTDGYQRNDNLMLSDHARADSIPGLEIQADDVRCTHGSTTGRVDDEMIFYAQCRGLSRKEATRMVVAGFFQQVFDRITIDSVREALGEAIGRRIREYE
ncbi:MAG TPA: Fe-S cluster assembly protein SufD [Pirellulales bacterium]|jgi:Fe-S cluster assembly protein SufD|nr:Fe-S cluster assembly protein SufD [Pirellulales bacterium]